MAKAMEFEREKLIFGILYSDETLFREAVTCLTEQYGDLDYISDAFSFSKWSDYYSGEIEGETCRRFVSVREHIAPEKLADVKTATNALEAEMSINGKRLVNIDPGLIGLGRLLLPTAKAAPHRIPLSKGIYAELTLFYSEGKWQDFPWTYRDYKSDEVKAVLSHIRGLYLKERRSLLRGKNNLETNKK